MRAHPIIEAPIYVETSPMVDAEFDRFEINNDFEMLLREAEPANFYHNALNEEE
ncbi:MAG: hypothetical protein ACOYJ2_03600 [Rickettsiales bacterium]